MGNKSIEDLEVQLQEVKASFKQKLDKIDSKEELALQKAIFTGKQSPLGAILSEIKSLSNGEKKIIGQLANEIKSIILAEIDKKTKIIANSELLKQEKLENIDITLPGIRKKVGKTHIITQTIWESEDIFEKMGFEIVYPLEIDNEYNNFEAVNIPKDHPARDSWDTFWTDNNLLAIPHTSSMQNRILSSRKPPIRAVVPGRCFRNESTDARHEHTFNQIEGIYVDRQITFADMLGTLKEFFTEYFQKEIEVKFTPDYFPFVEPGGMIALSCFICNGKGCNVCKNSGWLEILGCGMIHPKVLEEAGIDSNVYSGFAWGFGVERIIMLKYAIEDVRHFHSGNLDFLKQF